MSLHGTLTSLANAFALKVVGLAVDASINDINATLDGTSALNDQEGHVPQPREAPRTLFPRLELPPRGPMGIRAADYVEPLIKLVHEAPWATRSRELRAMLGVKKDPFLRIAELALMTGRIARKGYKATITYVPAKDGRPLKIASERMAAGARPKSKRGFHARANGGLQPRSAASSEPAVIEGDEQ